MQELLLFGDPSSSPIEDAKNKDKDNKKLSTVMISELEQRCQGLAAACGALTHDCPSYQDMHDQCKRAIGDGLFQPIIMNDSSSPSTENTITESFDIGAHDDCFDWMTYPCLLTLEILSTSNVIQQTIPATEGGGTEFVVLQCGRRLPLEQMKMLATRVTALITTIKIQQRLVPYFTLSVFILGESSPQLLHQAVVTTRTRTSKKMKKSTTTSECNSSSLLQASSTPRSASSRRGLASRKKCVRGKHHQEYCTGWDRGKHTAESDHGGRGDHRR
jgi:hypothetical protein